MYFLEFSHCIHVGTTGRIVYLILVVKRNRSCTIWLTGWDLFALWEHYWREVWSLDAGVGLCDGHDGALLVSIWCVCAIDCCVVRATQVCKRSMANFPWQLWPNTRVFAISYCTCTRQGKVRFVTRRPQLKKSENYVWLEERWISGSEMRGPRGTMSF